MHYKFNAAEVIIAQLMLEYDTIPSLIWCYWMDRFKLHHFNMWANIIFWWKELKSILSKPLKYYMCLRAFQAWKFWKHDFKIKIEPKVPHSKLTFWFGFDAVYPFRGHAHFHAKTSLKINATRLSVDRHLPHSNCRLLHSYCTFNTHGYLTLR